MKKAPHPYQSTQDRRKAIADAACRYVAKRGFDGLRTRDIAEQVGINIATFHYHVPTKEALIELIASSLGAEFTDLLIRNPRAGLSPLDQLKCEFSDYRETLTARPVVLQAMGELARRAQHDPVVAQHIDPINEEWRGQITDILTAGSSDGTFRGDLDIEASAHLVMAALISMPSHKPFDTVKFDRVEAELLRWLSPAVHPAA